MDQQNEVGILYNILYPDQEVVRDYILFAEKVYDLYTKNNNVKYPQLENDETKYLQWVKENHDFIKWHIEKQDTITKSFIDKIDEQIKESFKKIQNQTPKEKAIMILSWHLGCKPEDILDIDFKEENGILTINSFIPKQPIERITFSGHIEGELKKED